MQTDKIRIDQNGTGREAALDETSKFAVYNGISDKAALRIRLLAEETLGMVAAITESFEADFWLESTRDHICRIHLSAQTDMDFEKKRRLIDASRSKKNERHTGFMSKIRDIIQNSLFAFDEVSQLQAQYGYDSLMYGSMGMCDVDAATTNSLIYTWSMKKYQESLESMKEEDQAAAAEAWDELEKSIVASLADDVRVCVDGDTVEMIIEKAM